MSSDNTALKVLKEVESSSMYSWAFEVRTPGGKEMGYK